METNYTTALSNWAVLCRTLCFVGPQALTGIDRKLVPALQLHASTGDGFWSDCYQELLVEYWHDPDLAVELVMDEFVHTLRQQFLGPPLCWFGPLRGMLEDRGRKMHEEEVKRVGYNLTPQYQRLLVRAATGWRRTPPTAASA